MIYRRFRSYSQLIPLVVSLFGTHFWEDPNDLFLKISQKLRSSGIPFPTFRLPTPSHRGELLYEQGQLSLSAAEFERNGMRGRAKARKIRRQVTELNLPILESKPLGDQECVSNVLFYLNNSKPFTQSGYTERSHFILKALKEQGMNVRAVTRLGYPVVIGDFPRKRALTIDGIEYVQLLPALIPRSKVQQIELAVQMLVDEARRFDAEILHTTTDFKNAIVVSRAVYVLEIPWIYETRGELHKTWLSKRNPGIQELAVHSEFFLASQNRELEAMEKSAALVQLSEVSKRQSISQGISASKIHVVPNAVSESELGRTVTKPEIREELGLLGRKTLVGTITSIVPYEGLDDLIRATKLLPEVNCIIVGEGESKPRLERLVHELGLEERVRFVGKQPTATIWKWYSVLDIFVIPRKNQEVCRSVTPIKTLMAQANGVPVVSSDLPALREVTGNRAVYFPAENPDELAKALKSIINANPDIVRTQSKLARQWVRTKTWRANAEKLISVYRNSASN